MRIHEHADQDIRDQHCHLRELVESVHETLATRCTGPDTIGDMLDELAKDVLVHFAHEEAGGYFADAINIAPRLSERADKLLWQHPQLAEQLAGIRRHAETKKLSEPWWRELHRQFSAFVECFGEHEAAENALLLDAYQNDIGAED